MATFASWGLAAAVAGLVVVEGPATLRVLREMRPGWVAAGLGFYLLNHLLRAVRFSLLTARRVRWWPQGVQLTCLHGAVTYLLPLRTGDLALPAMLHGSAGMDWDASFRTLVKARLLDLAALGFWVLVTGLLTPVAIAVELRVAWLGCGAALLLAPLAVRCLARLPWHRGGRLLGWIGALGRVEAIAPVEFFSSALIWGAVSGVLYATVHAVNLPLQWGDIWFLVTVQLPLQLMPIQGVANTGNHEGGWVLALGLLGIGSVQALRFALAAHALLLCYVLILGGLGLGLRWRCGVRGAGPDPAHGPGA